MYRVHDPVITALRRGPTNMILDYYESLIAPPITTFIPDGDIEYLAKVIKSPRYSPKERRKIINEIMHFRGFVEFAGGTNRIVYTHPMAPMMVFKVAKDSVGIEDNPAEYKNQHLIKPFCTKVFECHPTGAIASFEQVTNFKTYDDFMEVCDSICDLIIYKILGKYVMEDIGNDYWMNFGIREGFCPVILDFPYIYELDGRKLYCNYHNDDDEVCGGLVKYDAGFNYLYCEKCGKIYRARDLSKAGDLGGHGLLITSKGEAHMNIKLYKNGEIIKDISTEATCASLKKTSSSKKVTHGDKIKATLVVTTSAPVAKEKTPEVPVNVEPEVSHKEKTVEPVAETKPGKKFVFNVKCVKEENPDKHESVPIPEPKVRSSVVIGKERVLPAKKKEKPANNKEILLEDKVEVKEKAAVEEVKPEIVEEAKIEPVEETGNAIAVNDAETVDIDDIAQQIMNGVPIDIEEPKKDTVEEAAPVEDKASKPLPERDEKGRFIKKSEEAPVEEETKVEESPAPEEEKSEEPETGKTEMPLPKKKEKVSLGDVMK